MFYKISATRNGGLIDITLHYQEREHEVVITKIEFSPTNDMDIANILKFKGLLHYTRENNKIDETLKLSEDVSLRYANSKLFMTVNGLNGSRVTIPLPKDLYPEISTLLDELIAS